LSILQKLKKKLIRRAVNIALSKFNLADGITAAGVLRTGLGNMAA
jgi:hypothetical protein